jgi:hypothetical protein
MTSLLAMPCDDYPFACIESAAIIVGARESVGSAVLRRVHTGTGHFSCQVPAGCLATCGSELSGMPATHSAGGMCRIRVNDRSGCLYSAKHHVAGNHVRGGLPPRA